MDVLSDHTVLLVGAGSGLGRGVARRCIEEGAQVAIFEISPEKVASAQDEFGPSCLVINGDCRSTEDLLRCKAGILERFGKLDGVMCFQGIFDGKVPLKDVPLDRVAALFDELFHINVLGDLLVARVFHSMLEESNGAFVFTSSNSAYAADGGGVTYTATKGAIRSLVYQLALEFSPSVRVNAVAPGAIGKSELRGPAVLQMENNKQSDIPDEAFAARFRALALMPERPAAEDYAFPYMFLASRHNKIMTGQTILTEQGLLNRKW